MEQTLEASSTGPTPGVKPEDQRDAQRGALRDLVALSADAAAAEAEIEQLHRTQKQSADKKLNSTLNEIAQRHEAALAQIAEEYERRIAAVREAFDRGQSDLKSHDAALRQRVEYDNDNAVGNVRSQLQQAVWLAESVFEATQNQIVKEYKKAKEEHATRNQELETLMNQATAVLMQFGQESLVSQIKAAPAAPKPVEPEIEVDEEIPQIEVPPPRTPAVPAASFEALRDAAKARLTEMESLQVPRLFVGLRPAIIVVLFVGAAMLIAQWTTGGLPVDYGTFTPQYKPIAIAGGSAILLCILAGIALLYLGHTHIRAAYVPLRQALDDARKKSDALMDESRSRRDRAVAHSTRRRNMEVNAAKEKAAPLEARAKKVRETALSNVKYDHDKRITAIEAQRRAAQAEADQWRQASDVQNDQQRDADIAAAHAAHHQTLAQSDAQYETSKADLRQRWETGLSDIQTPIEQGQNSNGQVLLDWADPRWKQWAPPRQFTDRIRFGQMQVDIKTITDKYPRSLDLPPTFNVPATLTFPHRASMMIHSDHPGRVDAIRTQQMVMSRLLTQLPAGRVRFTIIDPVGLGQNFAGFMHLADHDEALVGSRIWTETEHIEQQLANLTEHMETVIQKYLRNEFATIDDYNAQAGELAEPYRYLIIADFPVGFEGDSFRRLNSIATSGARCGVFFIIVRDTRQPLPGGVHLDELESHSINLVRKGDGFMWKDEIFKQFPLTIDPPPGEQALTEILDVVGARAKEAKRVEVPFETIAPPPAEVWTGDSASDIAVPIGRLGATRLQLMKLGRGVAQHALIAGKTGSGKSTLLHVLVTNLALWYAPDQVEFYLVDFKKGVEFKTYATHVLPHARAIAVESDREFGLSVLQRIDAELARRGELFRKLGVQDLASYRAAAKGQSLPPMPRTLLMIDEFQEFFSEDDKLAQEASLLLDRLVRQGRAFGIHVLLGSQTIGGSSGLARSTIGQMAVRIALQTSEADSQLILGDNNSAARLLSRPGEAIYNDAGGLVEANSPFQISWLGDDTRDVYLDRVRELARDGNHFAEPIVFEGNAPADITRNKRLGKLIDGAAPAARPPVPTVWLGDPVAIKDATGISFRQQSGANAIIVGQHEEAGMALISSTILSLAAQFPKNAAKFYLLDGTPADSNLAGRLPQIAASQPVETVNVEWRAIPDAMAEIAAEVKRRQESERQDSASIFVFIYGLQRYRMLRKSEESFGGFGMDDAEKKVNPDKHLADILREGPGVGVHVICWADTQASIERTFDRGTLREFDHRILFQMSAADSSNLIDSPAANKLGFHRALAYSEELGVMEKFRPYALPPKQWLADVAKKLASRS
jgi:hypothetical protein